MGRHLCNLEKVIIGILLVLKEGCSWRALDLPNISWQAIYGHFRRWSKAGLWDEMMHQLPWKRTSGLRMIDATHVKVHRDAANPAGGQEHQAMSRTKGGLNTKLHVATDARSQPRAMVLSAGSEADVSHAPGLIDDIEASTILMDKAYDSDALRQYICEQGMKSCIPPSSNRRKPASYNENLYKKRHRVENFFEKIKRMRRVATRYDKTDTSYMAFVLLACCTLCLRGQF